MSEQNAPNRRLRRQRWYRPSQRTTTTSTLPIQDTDCVPEVNVSKAVRMIREERGLSIRALAEKSGLAVNTLSLIENKKTSPSVSTLQQIAGALQVPITAFFETGTDNDSVIYTRAGHGPCAQFTHGTVEDLGAGLADRTIETFVFTMEPGAVSGPHAVVHTGQEFVYCLEGRIAYTVADHIYVLEPGDSLAFEAHLPHRWQNVDAGKSRAILVLCPLDTRDRATELHFLTEQPIVVQELY